MLFSFFLVNKNFFRFISKFAQKNNFVFTFLELESEYNTTKNKIVSLKQILSILKGRTIELQREIIDKEKYFSSCT